MAKSGWEATFQIQQHLLEKAGKIGQRTEAYNFDNLDQEVFKASTEIYEKELQQYFHIPPLGLTRFYQERFNELLDKHNLFETTLAEFLSILYLPMEKSFKVLQEKLQTMAQEGILPKEAKENYAIWVKILEGHYMNLFKSKEYTDALHNTISKMEDYILARSEALYDILQFFPVPTNRDMDDLYKEFHLLKKRISELEKKVKSA
jgi:polyhydroxyalkanoate synthesis regulator phasin